MADNCLSCSRKFGSREARITCFACKKIFHAACANIAKFDFQRFTDGNSSWLCKKCSDSGSGDKNSQTSTPEPLNTTHFHAIMNKIQQLCKEVSTLKTPQMALSNDVAKCNATLVAQTKILQTHTEQLTADEKSIADLQSANKDLSVRVDGVIDTLESFNRDVRASPFSADLASSTDYVISEAVEQAPRSNNIIIYGITDTDNTELDKAVVSRLLDCFAIDLLTVASFSRMGNFSTSAKKPRALKIMFTNSQVARTILIKRVTCLSNTEFSKLQLSDDKTPKQLSYFKSLRTELKSRQEKC
ncbi:hypothetical protein Zmor_010538 [Zophobas morio]|uniref:PHD-type domain-containing protein n=1 Tax=Zophobas morio TaxID=2755281 RepID=A0AA38IKC8_9CUCU|nr:hypothetical protein Zmor_010538 [Zophobas morio]